MPRRTPVPSLRRHRPSKQGVVRLNGKDHYLGRYGTDEADAAYEALIARWLANGRTLPSESAEPTVNEVLLAFLRYAEGRYVARGRRHVPEVDAFKSISRIVRPMFGRDLAVEFGPKKLKVVRERMMTRGWSRGYVNQQINRLKRAFKWAVAEEMVPSSVYHALQAVPALPKGTKGVIERESVAAVPEATVEACLPHMPPPVAAMVRLQMLTGMRPNEVVAMRSIEIEVSGQVWVYRPEYHKTDHLGKSREIYIGPKAQEVLKAWLHPELQAYLFSPVEAEERRHAERKRNRRTPMTPSQSKRQPKRNPKRPRRERYDVQSFRQAIHRACDKAFPPPEPLARQQDESAKEWEARLKADQKAEWERWRAEHRWHPNQLRHLAATLLRKEFGIELARIILGHSTAFTTDIYAEADRVQAMEVIGQVG